MPFDEGIKGGLQNPACIVSNPHYAIYVPLLFFCLKKMSVEHIFKYMLMCFIQNQDIYVGVIFKDRIHFSYKEALFFFGKAWPIVLSRSAKAHGRSTGCRCCPPDMSCRMMFF